MADGPSLVNGERAAASARRWKWLASFAKAGIALNLAFGVWVVGFRESEPVPILPDLEQVAFPLDLSVTATIEHPVVYAVEQRARPHYRVFSFDPATRDIQTVYTVPEDAVVYGLALSPDRKTLAVAYSPDYALEGNSLWMLDVASGELEAVGEISAGQFLTDLAWSPDGTTVLTTFVDRTSDTEQLSAVVLDAVDGSLVQQVDDAINPVISDGTLHFLNVDDDRARRSIGYLTAQGERESITVGDGAFDLDHLSADPDGRLLHVAILDNPEPGVGLTMGATAGAHGSHNVPSTWLEIDVATQRMHLNSFEPIVVYDGVATDTGLVYATKEGLSIATESRVDVIASRAIRLTAG